MSALTLESVCSLVRQLPALPAIVIELVEGLDNADLSSTVLARKLERDQGLVSRVLRVANSAFYGRQSQVDTVSEAIAVLGTGHVRALVVSAAVMGQFPCIAQSGLDPRTFWEHGLAVGCCAKVLARRTPADPGVAFICGLLHDIGRLAFAAVHPAEFVEVLGRRARDDSLMVDAERAWLGFDHAALGAALVERWKFPPAVKEAVCGHHDADFAHASVLTRIVHVADVMSYGLGWGAQANIPLPPIAQSAWDGLGLSMEAVRADFEQMETTFQAAATLVTA